MILVQKNVRIATPKNRNSIRKDTFRIRQKFGFSNTKCFPIMSFLEHIMPQIDPEFQVCPVSDNKLLGRAAETIPELHLINVKESVYDAACAGHHWARTVMAHELGHYIYHNSNNVAFAYPAPQEKIPNDINPEKQADIFSSELLVPINLIQDENEYLVSKHFGVPISVAKIQIRQAQKVKRRHEKRHRTAKKVKEKTVRSLA